MSKKMIHCPYCNGRIMLKKHRRWSDKLRGVASKYRCYDCGKLVENKRRIVQMMFGIKYS